MKDDLEHRSEVAVPVTSRRNFIGAAAATGVAGLVPAGLGSLSLVGSAVKTAQFVLPTTAQFVLPTAAKGVTPFKVHVPQATLDDLKKRLANTRWPDKEPVADWSQGVPLAKIRALTDYWARDYDWRRAERA